MDLLKHTVNLRKRGLISNDIRTELTSMGVGESEITQLLKDSDEIFLNQFKTKEHGKSNNPVKSFALVFSLGILVLVFLGYIYLGLLWLLALWMIISKSRFLNKTRNTFFKRYR